MSLIYQPAQDSLLLASVIPQYVKNKSVLDMGSGSGILAEKALQSGAKSVVAADINPESIKWIKSKDINAIQSDLFSNIPKPKTFDIIICNPPYLPKDPKEDQESSLATTGGKRGDEFILKFLKQAKNHLNKEGIIILLLSSLTPQTKINHLLTKLNLKHKIITTQKLFFETLEVWKIRER